MRKLTAKEELFCQEFVKQGGDSFGNASAAYRLSFNPKGKPSNVNRQACELLKRPNIAARVEELRANALKQVEFSIQDVLTQWINIVTIDTNEIVQHRRDCCRFCYGLNHMYKWIDEQEWADACTSAIIARQPCPEFIGGVGFTPNREPVKTCPKCFGDGIGRIYIADTRYLSPAAKLLYTGIEQTRNGGVRISFRSKDNALESIAKFLGMYKNDPANCKSNAANLIGDKVPKVSDITQDPIEASKIYTEFIGA